MPVIEVDHVSKEFRLGQNGTLRQAALNGLRRLAGKPVETRAMFKALDDVSFSVEQGEVLGIIGHNGAGKSTLLKLLANISQPTHGNVRVRGRVAPLIEVGAGLIGELTGRENIFLNATILGMRRREIDRKLDEIVAFAELEEFVDTPLKRYSSGMQVRLGFAIATAVESEILIVDEVLAVGDLAFQRKCLDRMEDVIRRQGRTVLLVSHNIRQIERICTRTILLNHGAKAADGETREVCGLFFNQSDEKILRQIQASKAAGRLEATDNVTLTEAFLEDDSGTRANAVPFGSAVNIVAHFEARSAIVAPIFGVGVHTTDSLFLGTEVTEQLFIAHTIPPGCFTMRFRLDQMPFLPGTYAIRIGMSAGKINGQVFYGENLVQFRVTAPGMIRNQISEEGFVPLRGTWSLEFTALANEKAADLSFA